MTATIGGMPNKPKTPHMAFRVPAELQDRVRRAAAKNKADSGPTATDAVRDALEAYAVAAGETAAPGVASNQDSEGV